jgi:hypothetical protein
VILVLSSIWRPKKIKWVVVVDINSSKQGIVANGLGDLLITKKFRPQLECILKGMYGDSPAGDVNNWNANLNSIVGGVCHQHPHCDHGRVGTYQDLGIYPFGALHGYGLTPFSLWILPPGVEYGFMHTFAADQIVFLRGDCVHAGVPSPVPRCHYEFFPRLSAG